MIVVIASLYHDENNNNNNTERINNLKPVANQYNFRKLTFQQNQTIARNLKNIIKKEYEISFLLTHSKQCSTSISPESIRKFEVL